MILGLGVTCNMSMYLIPNWSHMWQAPRGRTLTKGQGRGETPQGISSSWLDLRGCLLAIWGACASRPFKSTTLTLSPCMSPPLASCHLVATRPWPSDPPPLSTHVRRGQSMKRRQLLQKPWPWTREYLGYRWHEVRQGSTGSTRTSKMLIQQFLDLSRNDQP